MTKDIHQEFIQVLEFINAPDLDHGNALNNPALPKLLNLLASASLLKIDSKTTILSTLVLLQNAISTNANDFYGDNAWDIAANLAGFIKDWQVGRTQDCSTTVVDGLDKTPSLIYEDGVVVVVQSLLECLASIGHPRDMFLFACEFLHVLTREKECVLSANESVCRFILYFKFMLSVLDQIQIPRKASMIVDAIAIYHDSLALIPPLESNKDLFEKTAATFILYFKSLSKYADYKEIAPLLISVASDMAETFFANLSISSSIMIDNAQLFLRECQFLEIHITGTLNHTLGNAIILSLYFHPLLIDVHMPWVLRRPWIFNHHIDHICLLLERKHQTQILQGLSILEFVIVGLTCDSVTLSMYDDVNPQNGSVSCHQQIVKAMIAAIAGAPSQQLSQRVFGVLKNVMAAYTDEVKSRILLLMIMDSEMPSMIVAGITILKECIHKAKQKGLDKRILTTKPFNLMICCWYCVIIYPDLTHIQKTSCFASGQITDTFLEVLLDGKSIVYRNRIIHPDTTIFENTDLFFERYAILMHALNLYLYLLIREKSDTNRMGVWDSVHIQSVYLKLISPAQKVVNQAIADSELDINRQLEDIDSKADQEPRNNCKPCGTKIDPVIMDRLMSMQLLGNVLDRIKECIETQIQD
ncbi:hypothetical protein BATDEDRAFT_21664 [Batrachochytrium dendrobatidis JAM81]|uniref:Uncharacterized protein n=1 Tax=Batrachochytrium dendrobatidis (strain JAM81 / FGSC 10211) TaxID=684364 RepID=F4NUF0_BATDJ|nr:uncharacterized protein BATDEDRAFT_21664 [Batrachochytrium dendrobatidis JAM81]EGF83189.1 hypothetical protein BATDEDRAFT_21664 [Batrachochytrium dendrobatidis JAM81]|eukprot:XP_006675346.1 hypothetical protein BATDEDRAFT_21664 [Batrachochytrium dendrobatidis JAM81]